MLIDCVAVAAPGVGLPDLDEGSANGPTVLVEHPAAHDDPLSQRLPRMLTRQVAIELFDCTFAEQGPVE